MDIWKKNIAVLSQKDNYSYPPKKPISVAIGIVWIIVIMLLLQNFPVLIYKFVNREATMDSTAVVLSGFGNFAAALVLYLCFIRKEKKYYPTVTRKMTKLECASSLFFLLAVSGVISLIVDLIKFYTGFIATSEAISNVMNMNFFVQLFMSVISAGIAEEVLFRGCIQNRLMCRINNIWAMVITAALFGLIHGNVSQFITATVTGIAFCFVYAKTRSLWVSILTHMFNNLVSFLCSDFITPTFGDAKYWIVSVVLIVVSVVLAIPFVKGDAAAIEKSPEA